uniref:Uncharacterized protein n=1 Tax=Amphora coffeiformis TaxID=265554 RepID=A0A7S3P8P4_9STRA
MMMPDSHYEQQMMMMNNQHGFPHSHIPYGNQNNMMMDDRSFQADTPLNSNEASPSGVSMFNRHARNDQRSGSHKNNQVDNVLGKLRDPRENVLGRKPVTRKANKVAPRDVPNGFDPSA